jgi:hypothetical protein
MSLTERNPHADKSTGWLFDVLEVPSWDAECIWRSGWASGRRFTRDLMDFPIPKDSELYALMEEAHEEFIAGKCTPFPCHSQPAAPLENTEQSKEQG